MSNFGSNKIDIENHLSKQKEIYELLLTFIDESNDYQILYADLLPCLKNNGYIENKENIQHFLQLLITMSNEHCRKCQCQNFFDKINKILISLEDAINNTLTEQEIFSMFQSNKSLLLLLFQNKLLKTERLLDSGYFLYFLPEVNDKINSNIVTQLKEEIPNSDLVDPKIIKKKRQSGNNGSDICTLIQTDNLDDFEQYIKNTSTPLDSKIDDSIYESNQYLIGKNPTLIEYATFYGSTNIIDYLKKNDVEFSPSLWMYAVHSNNIDLICDLENEKIDPKNESLEDLFFESVKCHHNDIADHIKEKILNKEKEKIEKEKKGNEDDKEKDGIKEDEIDFQERLIDTCLRYKNYNFLPADLTENNGFFYLCYYGYNEIVEHYIQSKKGEIEKMIGGPEKVNDDYALVEAANNNQLEVVYYILSKRDSIGSELFNKNDRIKMICLPPSIKRIEDFAFYECEQLRGISIPSSVSYIGQFAFRGCSKLTHLTVPSSLESIEMGCFNSCSKLPFVSIPLKSTEIKDCAFSGCYSLKNVIIPSKVTKIGSSSFADCGLTSITVPPSVNKICDYAFSKCKSLKSVFFLSDNAVIGNGTFWKCKSLKNVFLPSSLTSIGFYTFSSCSELEKIVIPSSVKEIKDEAFKLCSKLKEVSIPSSVKSIGKDAFSSCKRMKNIYFEESNPFDLNDIGISPKVEVIITN